MKADEMGKGGRGTQTERFGAERWVEARRGGSGRMRAPSRSARQWQCQFDAASVAHGLAPLDQRHQLAAPAKGGGRLLQARVALLPAPALGDAIDADPHRVQQRL